MFLATDYLAALHVTTVNKLVWTKVWGENAGLAYLNLYNKLIVKKDWDDFARAFRQTCPQIVFWVVIYWTPFVIRPGEIWMGNCESVLGVLNIVIDSAWNA